MSQWSTIIALLFIVGCSQFSAENITSESEQLEKIIQEYDAFSKTSNPFSDSKKAGNNAKLPDLSAENLLNNHQSLREIEKKLSVIKQANLSQEQQINWSVLRYKIKNQLDNYINKDHYMPLTAESGFHADISRISRFVQFKTAQDYQDYLSRLKAIPTYFDQQIAWMELGIQEGFTQPSVVLQGFEQSIKAFIKNDVTQSVYYQPFIDMPNGINDETKQHLRAQASKVILEDVMAAYQQFYDFMVNRYQPQARENIAASSLPNGHNFYQNRVEYYTTLDISAEEIHQIGLSEVARIRAEMEAIIEKVGHQGDFASFVHFLRTDPQFYATSAQQLLKEAAYISKKMDAQLPSLFKTLPRTPYGVVPVPENIAPKYTTGRYAPPSREGQSGNYWVNTYRLDRRPLYVLEALTLHEAVPGHHLQGSIAREMKNVPKFRNSTYISAFGEGWGLYAEFLGIEAGFYQDPYSDFGRLTYEMWRACRLVVDTGMHVKGWSRDTAMAFLADNTALSLHNVQTEIDRYISWPAQALSYKIGELTIKKLRLQAEQALKERFDLREFHDEILKNGSMPLSMLEQVIQQYIADKN